MTEKQLFQLDVAATVALYEFYFKFFNVHYEVNFTKEAARELEKYIKTGINPNAKLINKIYKESKHGDATSAE